MATVILVLLAIALILAAAYVGLLLLRRTRPTLPPESDGPSTVGDLVRQRSEPQDDLSGNDLFTPNEPSNTAGAAVPPAADAPHPDPAAGHPGEVSVPRTPGPPPSTPPGGVEAGDAPWRRAARMMGAEPGGAWETAPLPVVPVAEAASVAQADEAGRTAVIAAPAPERPDAAVHEAVASRSASGGPFLGDTVPGDTDPDEAGRTAVIAVPAQGGTVERVSDEASGPSSTQVSGPAPTTDDADGPGRAEAVRDVVAGPALTLAAPTEAIAARPVALAAVDPPADLAPATDLDAALPAAGSGSPEPAPAAARPAPTTAAVWTLPASAGPAPAAAPDEPTASPSPVAHRPAPRPAPTVPDVSDTPSRPLSDPEMTPLMGIPIVRPLAADPLPPAAPSPPAASAPVASAPSGSTPAVPEPDPVAALVDLTVAEPTPAVTPPMTRSSAASDDEVVWMQSATIPDERPTVTTGSPQPVWFRVVRRDGEPVGGAVVSLLDDHGREADATKTATDGGGELHAPHRGRFLMIASAEGFQPRAALLTVEEQPVEIALLLPRSACVAGAVRADDAPLAGARVVARQEGEVVDEIVTDRDGGYRFDDLAEGGYALTVTHAHGSAVRLLTLSEGTDLRLDLDLTAFDSAR
jgi:Carboxypeptidase regulatory-like domain